MFVYQRFDFSVTGSLVFKKRTGNSAGNWWNIQIDPKLLFRFADLHDRRNQKRTLQMFSQQAIVTQHPKIMAMDDKKPQWSQTPCSTLKKTLKTMISHVHIYMFHLYCVFPKLNFQGQIVEGYSSSSSPPDAVHVPEAERRPPGRKMPPEPPGPSRRRCESLALLIPLGVRLPAEWVHMVWSKNNKVWGTVFFFCCGLRKESWKSRIQCNNIVVCKIWSWT